MVLHGNQIVSYFDPETTPGTSRTGQLWKVLAHHSSVTIDEVSEPVTVKKSGSVDNTSNEKGKRKVVVRINCNPSEADGAFFLKTYHSSDTALSFIFKNSGGTFLWRVTGCYVKNVNFNATKHPQHGAATFSIELWGYLILFTEPGTTTYTAVPDGFVNWSNCTMKIAAVTQSKWWAMSFTITNDLDIQHDENGTVTDITRGDRELDVRFQIALVDTASTQFNQAQVSFATVALEVDILADLYQFGACAYKAVTVSLDRTRLSDLELQGQPATLTVV